ncbi:hypothetical protein RGUI_1565 [Rhodovulum sp. P5]|uniref:c-type cytochrome n=1 Tax=Rhodovulum sp. P5 TaxID=1564506 RepID=UPI0009C2999F|nr:c-type cytochrome [Rhodovulum sp. P5]ARE39706.1 hypothetical protein RGUI_1565 [Rhodovulum sp. P5]
MRISLLVALALTATPSLSGEVPEGDADYGRELFSVLCVSCHNEDARGDERAPDIRGATIAAIRRGTSGMDSMQDFGFDEEQVLAMRAYLALLAD